MQALAAGVIDTLPSFNQRQTSVVAMHKVLELLRAQVNRTAQAVQSALPSDDALSLAHGNWSFPGYSRSELVEEALSIAKLIEEGGGDDIGEHEKVLNDYINRLQFLENHTIGHIWGNAGDAVPAYLVTLGGLRKALAPVLRKDDPTKLVATLKRLTAQLRGMEARLNALEPRTASVRRMVEDIERAHSAADQLPTDMEALAEARKELAETNKRANADQSNIADLRKTAEQASERLFQYADEARAVLERCETAYSAATSVGLAAAFSERSDRLSKSMWVWVIGLVAALATGGFFGTSQLKNLNELFATQDVASSTVALNISLAVLSVGAPIWFAWLSTKQIGQRFRLAEDYAYKASISRAYEGFRREAARVDAGLEAKLLSSALTRLDELPLRLVEATTHGSPWHELASSEVIRDAIKSVPGFGERVRELASQSLSVLKLPKSK